MDFTSWLRVLSEVVSITKQGAWPSSHRRSFLRRRFPGTSLLPVRNLTVAKGLPYGAAFPHASTLAVSLEIPVLGPAATARVDRARFSFADFGCAAPPRSGFPTRAHDELQAWLRRVRFQFREIELCLICEQILTALR